MFGMMDIGGRHAPVVVCDVCRERIIDPDKAAAVYDMLAPGLVKTVYHVHKGECHDAFDARLDWQEGTSRSWMEFVPYWTDAMDNIGMTDEMVYKGRYSPRG
jgi:hypothetical protein